MPYVNASSKRGFLVNNKVEVNYVNPLSSNARLCMSGSNYFSQNVRVWGEGGLVLPNP